MTYYIHDTKGCFKERLGMQGIEPAEIEPLLARLQPVLQSLQSRSYKEAAPLIDLAASEQELAGLTALSRKLQARFKYLVIAGSGGSGLGGKMLAMLKPELQPMSLHFLDNIDPHVMDDCLARIDLADSCFLIVSKSGTTVETLGQFYVLLERVKSALGVKAVAEQFIAITTPGSNPLRDSAAEYGFPVLDHDPAIGGRFSALSNVGLLPAAAAGVDIKALRRGAQSVVDELAQANNPGQCEPALGAALQYAYLQKGRNISVMLPYSERLAGFSSWYRQIWAESLGKDGKGSTPIRAVGTTDQHSQLQLYLDGPHDKLFHMVMLKRAGTGQPIAVPARKDLDYLRGKTTGDVMAAEQKATFETLLRNHCPVRLFELDCLNEESMGALLMHFMLEIIFMAQLLEVNPFDQPAVEEGKNLAREYLLSGNV